jgi:hypothetical protein
MSDYQEYYHNNPHEVAPMHNDELEQRIHDGMLDLFDEIEPSDYIDFGYTYDVQAIDSVIKGIAVAYYMGTDEQLLTYAKSLGKMITSEMERYVEENL